MFVLRDFLASIQLTVPGVLYTGYVQSEIYLTLCMGSLGQKVDFMQICKSTSAELNGVLNLECVSLKMEFSIQSRQTFLIVALKLSQKVQI